MPRRNPILLWISNCAVAAVAFVLLVAPLGVGFFTSRLNFTYGSGGLDPSAKREAVFAVALCVAAGIVFEAVFRRGLLRWLLSRAGRGRSSGGAGATVVGVLLHLIVINVLFAPVLYLQGARTDALSFGEMLLYENLLQIAFTAVYLGTGSFLLSGCLHGLFAALRFTVMNDVSGPFETLFFYSYSSDGFAWVLTLSPLLASSWAVIASWGLRSVGVLPRRKA